MTVRVIVFLLVLSSLLPGPARAQLWVHRHYDGPGSLTGGLRFGRFGPFGADYYAGTRRIWDRERMRWAVQPAEPSSVPEATALLTWQPAGVPRRDVAPDSVVLVQRSRNQLRLPQYAGSQLLQFTVEGAELAVSWHHRQLYLVPVGPVVTLRAWQGRRLLFTHAFRAIPPPLPEVQVYANFTRRSQPGPTNSGQIGVESWSSGAFGAAMPQDARYWVPEFRLTLLRDGRVAEPTLVVYETVGFLERFRTRIQNDDQVQIAIGRIKRVNFRGEVETIPYERRYVLTVRFQHRAAGVQ